MVDKMNLAIALKDVDNITQNFVVSELAAETTKTLGGGLPAQNWAKLKSMQMLFDGFSAASAVEISAKMAVRKYQRIKLWKLS